MCRKQISAKLRTADILIFIYCLVSFLLQDMLLRVIAGKSQRNRGHGQKIDFAQFEGLSK